MILDLSTQRKAIYDWAKNELEMEFIWADQSAHRPNKPYGSLKIIPGFTKLGNTDNLKHKSEDTFTIAGHREFTLSLNCYGESAIERASSVGSSVEKPSVIEGFASAGLAVVRIEQVNDLTRLMDNTFETRAQVDIRFRLAVAVDDKVGFIESTRVVGDIEGNELIIDI